MADRWDEPMRHEPIDTNRRGSIGQRYDLDDGEDRFESAPRWRREEARAPDEDRYAGRFDAFLDSEQDAAAEQREFLDGEFVLTREGKVGTDPEGRAAMIGCDAVVGEDAEASVLKESGEDVGHGRDLLELVAELV